jgi:hypothetical protein
METMDLVNKLMLGMGILGGLYSFIYGLLVWRGYFEQLPPKPVGDDTL